MSVLRATSPPKVSTYSRPTPRCLPKSRATDVLVLARFFLSLVRSFSLFLSLSFPLPFSLVLLKSHPDFFFVTLSFTFLSFAFPLSLSLSVFFVPRFRRTKKKRKEKK